MFVLDLTVDNMQQVWPGLRLASASYVSIFVYGSEFVRHFLSDFIDLVDRFVIVGAEC